MKAVCCSYKIINQSVSHQVVTSIQDTVGKVKQKMFLGLTFMEPKAFIMSSRERTKKCKHYSLKSFWRYGTWIKFRESTIKHNIFVYHFFIVFVCKRRKGKKRSEVSVILRSVGFSVPPPLLCVISWVMPWPCRTKSTADSRLHLCVCVERVCVSQSVQNDKW